MKISPTSVEAFDSNTPFGCERKWWFKYVAKVPDPGTSNQQLGTSLHAAVERFLLKGAPGDMAPDVARLFAGIKHEVVRVRDEGFIDLEKAIDFELAPDVRVVGRVDVVRAQGPLDWKTTSDLRYAPTPFKLAQSTQMLIYSRWQATAVSMPSQVTHVYVQTKGHNVAQRVDANMTPTRLTEGVARIISIVDRMKAAEKSKVEELPRSPEKCFRCPYVNICPADERNVMISVNRLAARLNRATNPEPAQPAAELIVPADAPAPTRRLPIHDMTEQKAEAPVQAPKPLPPPPPPPAPVEAPRPVPAQAGLASFLNDAQSQLFKRPDDPAGVPGQVEQHPLAQRFPALTQAEVPTVEEAPKRRGRPPGSKNKPKEPEVGIGSEPQSSIVFKTVTVSMTGKLNMGYYQSLDVHVSQTADYTGHPSEAFMQVMDVVKKQLDAALEGVAGRTVQSEIPPQVLTSTKR